MALAWKSAYASGEKLVLLALCDNANDQGECYPSTSMLAEKCSISERSVFNHLDTLAKDGAISKEVRTGRSTIYHINPCKFCTPANSAPMQPLHTTPATVAPPPLQPLHTTPATVAYRTISEPSSEPSVNQKKKSEAPDGELFVGVSDQVVADFKAMRKNQKAAITKTAIAGIQREADIAGISLEAALTVCCERNWRGFKAEWMLSPQARAAPAYQSLNDKRAETIAILTGKKSNERTIANERDIAGESRRVAG